MPWFLRNLRLVPLLLLVGGILIDFYTPARFSLEAFYVAAPMTAAALLSLRATILAGVGACAADAAMLGHFGYMGNSSGYSELAAVATVSAFAVVVNRLMRYRDVRLQSAREIALAVQRAVLRTPPAAVGPLRIAVRYRSAVREAQIGGDLYGVQDTPHGLRCLVGDVRGKGMETVKAVDVVLGVFREAAEDEPTLAGIAARLERGLLREAAGAGAEEFVTAVVAEIPPSGNEVRLVNCGHPPPLLHEPPGRPRGLEPSEPALPLCLGALAPCEVVTDTVPFPPSATLLLHTDGLTEARDRAGTFFDPAAALAGRDFPGPDELLDTLLAAVGRHTGGRITDDMALLAITRGADRGGAGPG
ncbi:PP2C family protein-serine/threonine phosphatase [Streptomyces caatingaensis]|uniref:Membrane protein n=1 Tax=Streptomyces caatingaensis TaxID=1678637 RepID=A0A0K9XIH8_9ACTN|nr:PP2C family protein-serine/threonine phosphatase [Streptomyces caatingaensis]KNB53184.1 membrane protein [Streptomyces caatingaensis]